MYYLLFIYYRKMSSFQFLTLVCNVKSRFILRIITVEEEAGFMRGAEQRLGNLRPTEPVNHRSSLRRPASDLQVVVDRLGGKVQELHVDSLDNISTMIIERGWRLWVS